MKKGIIALLDALGVKGIWSRANHDRVIANWQFFLSYLNKSIDRYSQTDFNGKINVITFSDTVLISIETDSDPISHLPMMSDILVGPFYSALIHDIFFRGVISIGQFINSEQMVLGPAVDEAAEWYSLPNWIGISLCPSAMFGLKRLQEQGADPQILKRSFIEYSVPMKQGIELNHEYAIPWPLIKFDIDLDGHKNISSKTALLDFFSKNSNSYMAYEKYKNTYEFVTYCNDINN